MPSFIDALVDEMPTGFNSSVCIIGAGAAGISLALRLAKTISDVVLIESGSFEIDGATQGLYNGRNLGLPYYSLTSSRLRYLGGTTNHWGGYCRANDPVDYEGRPELNLPKWPINDKDLAPYIAEASALIGVENMHFSPGQTVRARGMSVETLAENESEILKTKVFLLARKLRFGAEFRSELEQSPNLRVVLNLNATKIRLNESGTTVEQVVAQTMDGKSITLRAGQFVLCCHAIENARLMLDSDDVQTAGVGNATDQVGRYFMDHIHIHASRLIPTDRFPRVYDYRTALKANINANLSFTDDFTRSARLLQYYCRFNPVFVSQEARDALAALHRDAFEPGSLAYLRDIRTAVSELNGTVRKFLKFADILYSPPDYYVMEHRIEQAPNPESRVVLSDRKDALGSRVADLDWRILDLDVESFAKGQAEIGRELAAMGWGRIEEEEITRDLVEERVEGHYHHIGTTRMGDTPATGVVDRNCKVFGVDNLYVAGSSVFPTAGYSGPTMMIVALSLRLADHLAERV